MHHEILGGIFCWTNYKKERNQRIPDPRPETEIQIHVSLLVQIHLYIFSFCLNAAHVQYKGAAATYTLPKQGQTLEAWNVLWNNVDVARITRNQVMEDIFHTVLQLSLYEDSHQAER